MRDPGDGSRPRVPGFFSAIAVAVFSISAYYRWKARRTGEVIPRAREGARCLALRLGFASPLYLGLLAYMVNPGWLAWSALPLRPWLRWLGVAVGLAVVPLVHWVLRTLGSNITETALTKEHHVLVTGGPYRWVRHPLYSVATVGLLALGLVAASWFILGMAALSLVGIALVIIPREEAQLVGKFGMEYRSYTERTGRLLPRVKRLKEAGGTRR